VKVAGAGARADLAARRDPGGKSGYCVADSLTCETPTCEDGVENGNETDVDCGGACDADCDEGEGCEDDADCVTGACGPDDVCVAAECKAEPEDNMCQSCLKETKCTCWLECVAHNNDFEPCKFACGIKGNPGQITACANNNCNSLNACALPEV
jgi:hypothetical protein